MSGYAQLTHGQRYQIEALLKTGHNQTRIAEVLSVHKSTLSRELKHIIHPLNHRPQRPPGFKTPYELFFNEKTSLTVALEI